MSETQSKYKRLIELLYKRTTGRQIAWNYEAFDDEVHVKIAEQRISVSSRENQNSEPLIVLQIRNPEGIVIESFSDEDLSGSDTSDPNFRTYYQMMSALYDLAVRQATGADNALDSVLEELSTDPDDLL